MTDYQWDKDTATAVLRLLSTILMAEGVFMWIFSYSDAVIIFTGFVVFLIGDLGFLLSKSPFWENLFDRAYRRAMKIKRQGEAEKGGVVVEAKLRKTPKKPKKRMVIGRFAQGDARRNAITEGIEAPFLYSWIAMASMPWLHALIRKPKPTA